MVLQIVLDGKYSKMKLSKDFQNHISQAIEKEFEMEKGGLDAIFDNHEVVIENIDNKHFLNNPFDGVKHYESTQEFCAFDLVTSNNMWKLDYPMNGH